MFKGNLHALLHVADVRESVQFYRTLGFGFKGFWNPTTRRASLDWPGSEPPTYAEITVANSGIGLSLAPPEEEIAPAEHHIEVDDVDAYFSVLEEKGLRSPPPDDTAWGWRMFSVADPDGHCWGFYTLKG